jgi:hypothetical protein
MMSAAGGDDREVGSRAGTTNLDSYHQTIKPIVAKSDEAVS